MSIAEVIPGPGMEFERTPPQDIAAEQGVLGGMLLSKDAIADVIEVIRGGDFYRPAHEMIYDVALDLYSRGEPADAVTVSAELTKRGEIGRVGGAPYLHTLISSVPTAANAGYYARIVRERAILRRLVEAGTRITQLGYSADGDVDDVVDRAQAEVYSVTERRVSEDYLPLSSIMQGTLDEIEAIDAHDGSLIGVPTGFADLDALTNGLHPGQMVIVAARPAVGKSTLALDIARSATIAHNLPTVFFSLEMGRNEITMRLLAAEAKVHLQHMRSGTMREEDWDKLARRMNDINAAPLFIDDSPNMSMMEIRAKCRRLKQRHGLRLVIVDYLQLMTSGKRVESRQVEVSEFSRSMKLLAKELDVPVIAICQLNRGPEQRTDKKPMLSDLRESGCLTADTRLLRADNGAEISLGELVSSEARDVPVWAYDDRLKLVPRTLTHAFPSGTKPTFAMRLASGRELTTTANHRFLTLDGWRALSQLSVGDRLGVARHVPPPLYQESGTSDQAAALAPKVAESVPAEAFAWPKSAIASLLRRMWEVDGSVSRGDLDGLSDITYPTASRRVADDVAQLLARLNVLAHIRMGDAGQPYRVEIPAAADQLRFLDSCRLSDEPGTLGAEIADRLRSIRRRDDVDQLPRGVWREVQNAIVDATRRTPAATPRGLAGVVQLLDATELELLATNDVYWDTVVSIEPAGEQAVYDATVLGVHNFVANGIAAHNSLEQDADVVMLLHREDLYERESPRAGEADIIVAKHRNGPTGSITVAFQGHYSRFVDMARG